MLFKLHHCHINYSMAPFSVAYLIYLAQLNSNIGYGSIIVWLRKLSKPGLRMNVGGGHAAALLGSIEHCKGWRPSGKEVKAGEGNLKICMQGGISKGLSYTFIII